MNQVIRICIATPPAAKSRAGFKKIFHGDSMRNEHPSESWAGLPEALCDSMAKQPKQKQRMVRSAHPLHSLAVLVLSALATTLHAADQTWIDNGPSNLWNTTDLNWEPGVAWTQGNNAIFGGTGETVTLDTGITVGNISFNSGGYTISGNTLTLASSTIATGANNAAISSTLAGSSGFTKNGSGRLELGGTNTITGGISLSQGTTAFTNTGAFGTSSTVTVGGGTGSVALLLRTSDYLSRPIVVNPQTSGTVTLGTESDYNAGNLVRGFSGAITLNGDVTLQSSPDNIGNRTDFSGAITGTGNVTINDPTNSGYKVLFGSNAGGASNTWVGGLTINAGAILQLGAGVAISNGIPDGTTVVANGTLNVARRGVEGFNGLTGTGSVNLIFNTDGINVGGANGSASFSGSISGLGSVTKSGTGTQTLSGTNTFTGALTVSGGTLAVPTVNNASADGPLGNRAGAVLLGSSGTTGTLEYTGATAASNKPFTAVAGGTAAFSVTEAATTITLSGLIDGTGDKSFGGAGSTVVSGVISGGNLFKTGLGSLTLAVANTYAGDTIVSGGTLKLGSGGSFANSPRIIVGDAGSNGAVFDVTDKTNFSIDSAQTLMGKGTVLLGASTNLAVAGLFSPGNSPGLFTFDGGGTATLTGTTLMEIQGTTRGTAYDAVDVLNGTDLTFGGVLNLDFSQTFADGTSFNLFTPDGTTSLAGNFSAISMVGSAYSDLTFTNDAGVWTTNTGAANQSMSFDSETGTLIIVVPEPATLALAGTGLAIIGCVMFRRRCRR